MNAADETGSVEHPRRFSDELALLTESFAGRGVSLREVLAVLHGRAYLVMVMLLCLPFVVPVSVPGMSTPFGTVIALIAASLMAGREPWLPARLLDRRLPAGFLGRVISIARRVVVWLEELLRPRLPALFRNPALPRIHASVMFFGALLLALPLPIPFTNMIPGWAIFLVAAGLLERDGLFIVAGYIVLAISLAYFLLLGESAHRTLEWMTDWIVR
jgi:hypothetical protein